MNDVIGMLELMQPSNGNTTVLKGLHHSRGKKKVLELNGVF